MNGFRQEHLERWMVATRRYLSMDLATPGSGGAALADDWSPPRAESQGGRRRFLARVRGRLMRRVPADDGDGLRELERVFLRQVWFVVTYPDVPRRLRSWLVQNESHGLGRRARRLIDQYVLYLARIIGRAKQQGLVRPDIQPQSAANLLVGVIQGLGFRTYATPQPRELVLREAAEVFALFRAQLVG